MLLCSDKIFRNYFFIFIFLTDSLYSLHQNLMKVPHFRIDLPYLSVCTNARFQVIGTVL